MALAVVKFVVLYSIKNSEWFSRSHAPARLHQLRMLIFSLIYNDLRGIGLPAGLNFCSAWER
ncbi:hypothetical protein THIOM_002465 [Candidatus Thiomargarita nelsonii]|uniref:Uncharacterized protein n=1 Tax=Candidatus Thiomargarita nelsonii TaxID=1003181 RepID=A0A176S125_9GAMM|nr:hypothetical protein THIOM_002465 [Candidatus Thiomargarita nelsonii]